MMAKPDFDAEWIEADGLGGFASGTAGLIRNRRYHALLLAATQPPTGRMVLVNGIEVWIETASGRFALSAQRYAPDVVFPNGQDYIEDFQASPWPRWHLALPDGTRVEHGVVVVPGHASVLLYWRLLAGSVARLSVRPLLSGRDYHSLHHENGAFNFNCEIQPGRVVVRPYPGVPAVCFSSDGGFVQQPDWYRNFLYQQERERGLDDVEDLASPGVFSWDLARGGGFLAISMIGHEPAAGFAQILEQEARRRRNQPDHLVAAADIYIVRRDAGKTIIAGYPWFTDWGRDTFISMRGLCLARGRLDEACEILMQWAGTVADGMLPNRFPDAGESPEYNSVDASLWYIIAVHDFLAAMPKLPDNQLVRLRGAIHSILEGYTRGTRYGIAADPADGLLMCGQPGVQLTWMDAKVGDWVVTPRIGKPVEVQALWLNALRIASAFDSRWEAPFEQGLASFIGRFHDPERGCLYDVIDNDREPGAIDRALRPNQIFAVGGLPYALLAGPAARAVVDTVEARLLTPAGLRTLAPGEPGYIGHYGGNQHDRDAAYHQGTVWPWLIGPFGEAWLRVRQWSPEAKAQARERFLLPLYRTLDPLATGQLPEIADGDAPHTARGCPFQAWSVGEALRLRAL